MSSTIDPMRLAQFMVLPGAAELIEAFASLPPGELRDSAVSHVQVLARASGWDGPQGLFVGEPPGALDHHTPHRLAGPAARELASVSADGQIVERLLQGDAAHVVADAMGVQLGYVVRLATTARRAGVIFPGDDRPGARVPLAKAGKAGKVDGRKTPKYRAPVPPPPWWWEDPTSPIWDNPRLLPSLTKAAANTLAAIGPHDGSQFAIMTKAAARRGLTLRAYIAERYEILRRADAGEAPRDIGPALGISPDIVGLFLNRTGKSWMARTLAKADETARPVQVPNRITRKSIAARERWGFADEDAAQAAREKVRDLRLRGNNVPTIARQTGYADDFINTAIQYWKYRGVAFGPQPGKRGAKG